MRSMKLAAAVLLGVITLVQQSLGQPVSGYPAGPIKWIVPLPPGGITDRIARAYGDKLKDALGQPIVVENRPGANTLIGTEVVAQARADGHTFLSVTPPLLTGAVLYPKANWPKDVLQVFTPVSNLIRLTNVIVVPGNSPYMTIWDLIRTGKADPTPIAYGASSLGSVIHLAMEEFGLRSGVRINVVAYKGGPPMLTDLIGGHLSLAVDNLTNSLPQIRAGKLRALLVLSDIRNPAIPAVPTTADLGMKDFEASGWQGVAVAAGTPQHIVDRLEKEFIRISALPEIKHAFEGSGDVIVGSTSAEFANLIRVQGQRNRELIRKLNIRPE